jgi:cytochrome oxidase assembly protein ShyY1
LLDTFGKTETHMKLVLQIALGVFLGTLTSAVTLEIWQLQRESEAKQVAENLRIQQEQVRHEQGERIRAMLLQGRKGQEKSPDGFVPDDAQSR